MSKKNTNETPLKKPELLAPAGDFTSMQSALQSGCDAVYFGVSELNMRQGSANFAVDDLQEVANRCREFAVKPYLTLNTIIFQKELPLARQILEAAKGLVAAVICWDPAIIELCRELELPIHVSTQASVSNAASTRFYQNMGAVRIVPARECTLEELKRIKEETGMEMEVFVHGAMCVSVSGRCYMSEFTHGKSGNRGECLQNCRRTYDVTDSEEGHAFIVGNHHVMSAKDLCTLPFIDQLCDAEIDAFKIEGRGRNPQYVKTVVAAYRAAIDAWAEGTLTQDIKDQLVANVRTVYNRTFSSGFYMGRPIGEFTHHYGSVATHTKEYVGVVTNYYRKVGVVQINIQNRPFQSGDPLTVLGQTTGVVDFTPQTILQNDVEVTQTTRGVITTPIGERVRIGDKVYIIVERKTTT